MPDINASSATTDTIVLIHGLWMTPLSWEHWVERYERRGFEVLAPAWPGMEGDAADLRRDSSPIAVLTAAEIIDYYDRVVRPMDPQPIIMGHSFGGAFTQVLLDRGLGAVGVAIDSAPPKGVPTVPWSTVRSGWPVVHNPSNLHRAVPLTPEQFHYAFANCLSDEESLKAYDRYYVPASGHVLFEGFLANVEGRSAFKVDFHKTDRAPLLFIAGGEDHIIPPSVNTSILNHYEKTRSSAVVEYMEYPGRCHFTLGQSGWEDVADYALEWAVNHAAPKKVPVAAL